MVEYALIVGVVSVGLVALFLLVPFGSAFNALGTQVCNLIGGTGTCT